MCMLFQNNMVAEQCCRKWLSFSIPCVTFGALVVTLVMLLHLLNCRVIIIIIIIYFVCRVRWLWRKRLRLTAYGLSGYDSPVNLHNQQLLFCEHQFWERVLNDGGASRPSAGERERASCDDRGEHALSDDDGGKPHVLPVLALNEVYIGESLSPRSVSSTCDVSSSVVNETLMQNHTLATLPQSRCSSQPGNSQQNCQIWWTGRHAYLLPSCHRNRRYLESLGCPGYWQTGHINHWRTQRIHLSVSAFVNSPPKGKCGRLSQHIWLWLDAVAVIPCLVHCLKPVALWYWAKKIIIIIMIIIIM